MEQKKSRLKSFLERISRYKYVAIINNAIEGIGVDKIQRLSASLAYTAIFSLAPLLLLVILIGSTLAEKSAIEGRVFAELSAFVGDSMAEFVQNLILQISFEKSNTTIATIISSSVLFVIASGVFVEVQDSLNTIWGVRPKKKKGFVKLILSRLISFTTIIAFGVFLAVMIIINTVFIALSAHLLEWIPWLPINTINWLNTLFLLMFMTLFFAMLFKLLPDVSIKWRDVWGGAMLTTVLFLISKWLISIYVKRNMTVSFYGAAGSVVILMLWIYFSAFIFYFGAEYIRSVAEYKGRKIQPNIYAELSAKRLVEKLRQERNIAEEELEKIVQKEINRTEEEGQMENDYPDKWDD